MRIALTTLILTLLLASAVWSQEDDTADENLDAAAETEDADEPALDGEEVDEPGYDPTEEEDFRPSEDIKADKSIAFPTDI